MELRLMRSCLLGLTVIIFCSSILALDASAERRDRERPISSVAEQSSSQERIRLPRRLSSRHGNQLAPTDSTRKSSSLLIGGHMRAENNNSSTQQPSNTTSQFDKEESASIDDGLLLSSAGNGKEKKSSTSSNSDDDEKKTLSQQVKEGKYGLIQNELYSVKPKRPGIISYSSNPEVPGDTAKNLGGLNEEEIWLAENHVLVLKGGNFPESDGATEQAEVSWPPIDDYKAPRRQVKIPPRPKVPPPFPIQLIENGPVQLIGTNGSSLISDNGTIDFEALPGGFRGFLPGEGPYFPFPTPNNNNTESTDSSPKPEKKTKAEGPPGPFFPALPPGAVIVPPPSNQTDYDDEDQSIYYPPPYSFVYSQDNTTDIPPGPLVPGIILPPPPDFFSSLDDNKSTTKDRKEPTTSTALPVSRPASYLPPRKSSTKLYKTVSVTSSPAGSKSSSYSPKPFGRTKLKNSTYHHYRNEKTTPRPYQTVPFVEVTTPIPVKSTSGNKYLPQVIENQVIETSTEKTPWRGLVSSKAVPLVSFYSASTTPSSVDQPVETTPVAVGSILTTTESPTRYPSQASYYFYEEAPTGNREEAPSSTVEPIIFYGTTAETPPYYKLEELSQTAQAQEEDKKEYYDVEMIPSQQTSKDYNVKLIDSVVKNPQIYRYLDSGATSSQEKFETPPARSPSSPRLLHSEPLYYQPAPTHSSPKLSYFTTPKPIIKSYLRKTPEISESLSKLTNKPKPIYQYSFEANNYSKYGSQSLTPRPDLHESPLPQQPPQQQQSRRQKKLPVYSEYQNIQAVTGEQYDYEGTEPVADQQVQTEQVPYLSSKKKERAFYRSTTASPVPRDTTLASHQQYFTKQDEQLLDDVTKEYFTVFGKKLSGNKLPSTTPIYGKSSITERPTTFGNINNYQQSDYNSARQQNSFRAPNIKVHYGDQTPGPYSLKDDILINYKHPLSQINPDSEFISVVNPSSHPATAIAQRYRPRPVLQAASQVRDYPLPVNNRQRFDQIRGYTNQRIEQPQQREPFAPIGENIRGVAFPPRPVSLHGDVAVNYKLPRPPINPDAEFIGGSGAASLTDRVNGNPDKSNSYFAYRLPGDGGHFYFLTPQAISREDPNGSYLYSRPRGSRMIRRRRERNSN